MGKSSITDAGEPWITCTVEAYIQEPNDIRRLDILLPASLGSIYFLHVDTP